MTKPTKKECKIHAKSIREASTRYLKSGLSCFKGDKEMVQTYRSDAKDMREVATLLCDGKYKEAFSKAQYLDTIVRDAIPNKAWEFLRSHEV